MRITLGAAGCAALVLIVGFGAPVVPVVVGAVASVVLLSWRGRHAGGAP